MSYHSATHEQREIITCFKNRHDFLSFLSSNPNTLVIVKLGANWCGPCAKIKGLVEEHFANMPSNIICCNLDVDENEDLFSFFKTKQMAIGIPALLCMKGLDPNMTKQTPLVLHSTAGANVGNINKFFALCSSTH